MKLNRKNKKGFTIVELVIVIAVIGILSAVLIPTFVNLSNQAQETAKKQQVADAYTAYLVEATDNKYDNLYTRSTSEPYTYTAQNVAIVHKAQAGVVMMLKDEWFTYTAEKGWEKGTGAVTNNKALVVKYYNETAPEAATYLFHKEGEGYTQLISATENTGPKGDAKLSTFNGVTVYYKTTVA